MLADKSLPDNETRIVPFRKVADATHAKISLNCSKADVAGIPPFLEAQLIDAAIRLEGPVVRQNQHTFASDWMSYADESPRCLFDYFCLPSSFSFLSER